MLRKQEISAGLIGLLGSYTDFTLPYLICHYARTLTLPFYLRESERCLDFTFSVLSLSARYVDIRNCHTHKLLYHLVRMINSTTSIAFIAALSREQGESRARSQEMQRSICDRTAISYTRSSSKFPSSSMEVQLL